MKLNASQYQLLKNVIEKDSKFLRHHNLMDYSLLLAIELVKIETPNFNPNFLSVVPGYNIQDEEMNRLSQVSGSLNIQNVREESLDRNKVLSPIRSLVNRPEDERLKFVCAGTQNADCYQQIYHISIIDFLQDWSLSKRMERRIKGNNDKISAVPPILYQERFNDFVSQNVLRPANESLETEETIG